ncbi:hypothetical protein EMIHUDRAFT_438357, partial [Emiliania huxleyi CCMP1516]|uniref:Uncharacterized protein n=2 Tax=Emiliania huxleyi TaxID=2903 RepID=A0A0D3IB03_EMIH1
FSFESRRPFEHVTCVPRARPQQGQHASPAGRSHRRPRRRQGGKGWQGRRQGRWQGWWPWRTRPALRRRPQRPIYSVRAGGATAAEVRPPATSHGVERRRDGPESRHQVCHDRGREARGDGCARPALRRRPQRPILDQSRRSDGGGDTELRPPATSHGVERRRDGPESRHQVCHDRGREARGDGCARPALRRRPQRPILDQSRRSDGGGVAAAGDLPLDHAADPSTSTCGLPSRRRRRSAAHPEPAGAAWAGAGA